MEALGWTRLVSRHCVDCYQSVLVASAQALDGAALEFSDWTSVRGALRHRVLGSGLELGGGVVAEDGFEVVVSWADRLVALQVALYLQVVSLM